MFSILLLDTNSSFSATFANLLRHSGYRVETAQTQSEASAQHAAEAYDLILLGIPDADSIKTALRRFPDVKIILLLPGHDGPSPPVIQVPDNVPVFYKPFRTEEVLATIYATLVGEGRRNDSADSITREVVHRSPDHL